MNAVNLIPLERRRVETPTLPGAGFLGLLVGLVLALAATVVYVDARNTVSARQGELTHVRAGVAEWSAAAARYAPAVAALKHRTSAFAQLGGLLAERYDWSDLLSQLAGVMPAHAQLSALTATAAGSASATTASGTTGASSSSSGITISGCAASQPVVADTMVALRRLSGVSAVSLSNSSRKASGSTAAGGASGCKLPVSFTLSLQFNPTAARLQMPGGLSTGVAGSTPASTTPSTTGTTATTTQSASTSPATGAAQ